MLTLSRVTQHHGQVPNAGAFVILAVGICHGVETGALVDQIPLAIVDVPCTSTVHHDSDPPRHYLRGAPGGGSVSLGGAAARGADALLSRGPRVSELAAGSRQAETGGKVGGEGFGADVRACGVPV